jgi:hypothetical protein
MATGDKARMLQKFGEELCKVANDRTRLQIAFEKTLNKLGLPDSQINKIVKDVRAADFDSLHKTLKLD